MRIVCCWMPFPDEKQGIAMTILGFAALIGPVVGPTLGGWLKGWRFGRAPSRSGTGPPSAAALLLASASPASSSSSRNFELFDSSAEPLP